VERVILSWNPPCLRLSCASYGFPCPPSTKECGPGASLRCAPAANVGRGGPNILALGVLRSHRAEHLDLRRDPADLLRTVFADAHHRVTAFTLLVPAPGGRSLAPPVAATATVAVAAVSVSGAANGFAALAAWSAAGGSSSWFAVGAVFDLVEQLKLFEVRRR